MIFRIIFILCGKTLEMFCIDVSSTAKCYLIKDIDFKAELRELG